jgi:type II secretory pathway component GspD/PulD (secretin)
VEGCATRGLKRLTDCRSYGFTALLVGFILLAVGESAGSAEPASDPPQPSSAAKPKPRNVVITRETMKERVYKLIPLDSISFETVETMIRPLLTDGGLVTFEQKRNSILVYDFPEVIAKVQAFLKEADRPLPNVRIDVDSIGSGGKRQDGLDVTFDYGKGPTRPQIIVENGKVKKPETVRVNPYSRSETNSRLDSSFITTKSGYPASLWVGKTILDPSWLNELVIRPTYVIQGGGGPPVVIEGTDVDFKWADVGTSLEVLPTVLENGLINIKLCPRISYLDGKVKKQAVMVESLATEVTVADGQRVSVGGMIDSKRDKYTSLFGPDFFRREDTSKILDMYLTATIMDPAGRPARRLPMER